MPDHAAQQPVAAVRGPAQPVAVLDVRLIDSAEETAAETGRVLARLGLCANGEGTPTYRFVASDAPEQFLRLGQLFLGETVERVETVTLG